MAKRIDLSGIATAMVNILSDRIFLNRIGQLASDIIRNRVRSRSDGGGVSSDSLDTPQPSTLKPLTSLSYIKRRGTIKLGPFGSARRSNLTLSGQMLNAIKYRISPGNNRQVTLFINNDVRRSVFGEKKTPTNAEVADWVSSQGRPFFALTEGEQRILRVEAEDEINRRIETEIGRL